MNFQEAIITCFKKYFTFSGRARRSEYWWFILFSIIIGILLHVVEEFSIPDVDGDMYFSISYVIIFSLVIDILLIPPFFAVAFRRLHDIGKSGWWILLIGIIPIFIFLIFFTFMTMYAYTKDIMDDSLIMVKIGFIFPVIGWVILIYWLTRPSAEGENKFGVNPIDA